jgi:hypothetical protein
MSYDGRIEGVRPMATENRLAEPCDNPTPIQREIRIAPLSRGYVVNVGCKSFGFESHKDVVKMIGLYLANPEKVEKDYFNGTLFND